MSSANKIEPPRQSSRHIVSKNRAEPVKFLICNYCFWCTSLLNSAHPVSMGVCPSCRSDMIESMSIEPDEDYSFQNDEVSGIILVFQSSTGFVEETVHSS